VLTGPSLFRLQPAGLTLWPIEMHVAVVAGEVALSNRYLAFSSLGPEISQLIADKRIAVKLGESGIVVP
jgi:hypothetical protein